jgi:tRNA 5-methylaminomethyl-2-thiouridine biosynthesis bifunctional protein
VLTLLFGDVLDVLHELDARAQAFFSGRVRAGEESADVERPGIRRVRAVGCTGRERRRVTRLRLAVRDGLQRAGFMVRKAPGFGRKRDMLCARFPGQDVCLSTRVDPHHAIVIGGRPGGKRLRGIPGSARLRGGGG